MMSAATKKTTSATDGGKIQLPAGDRGAVTFHDWISPPWEPRLVRGMVGRLTIVSAADLLGHDVNSRDSNWAILIDGDTQRFVALGCQVRAVTLGAITVNNGEYVEVP